jgi:hypothetical protein
MATGSLDTNGVWNYGEDDSIALFSDLLNLGTTSTSDAFTADRARLATIESNQEATTTFVAASATARDSRWGLPTTSAAQLVLQNLGARTIRTDTGFTEQYFAIFHASTNPGGRLTAGWYPLPQAAGLLPVRPSAVTFVTGTGSVTTSGDIAFSGCTAVHIEGAFLDPARNYRVIVSHSFSSGVMSAALRFRSGNAENQTANYFKSELNQIDTAVSGNTQTGLTNMTYAFSFNSGAASHSVIDIFSPGLAVPTGLVIHQLNGTATNLRHALGAGGFAGGTAFTGLTIYPGSGQFSGNIAIQSYAK